MRYFDFHTHIILKQCFAEQPVIDSRINRKDVDGLPRACSDLPNIVQTQIHQSQLANFNGEVIVGVVLYGLESYLAKEVIQLRTYLRKHAEHKLSKKLLENASDLKVSSTYKIFTDFVLDLTFRKYKNAPESFNIINRRTFHRPLPDKINIFFVIEGCHSLVDTVKEALPPYDQKRFDPQEILANLDLLINEGADVISINPTHMQQSNLCSHAFGMQVGKSQPFYPSGNGLSDDGRTVIQGFFDRNVCVDLKHMSYKSRLDLRKEIDTNQYDHPMPLLCTHAGFTGVPFTDWPGYISRKKEQNGVVYIEVAKSMQVRNQPQRPGAPAFNMTTINLFDEEIAWIVQNNGMIGLSMDRRILGYVSRFDDDPAGRPAGVLYVDKEYISLEEWNALGIRNSDLNKKISLDDCVTEEDVVESTEGSIPRRDEYFYDHILLQLKHYLQVCYDAGIPIRQAQKHLTIGSDFDGLINPFINMPTVDDMADLKDYIKMNFKFYLQSLTDSKEWEADLDVSEFVEDLFYLNGFHFLQRFFSTIPITRTALMTENQL